MVSKETGVEAYNVAIHGPSIENIHLTLLP